MVHNAESLPKGTKAGIATVAMVLALTACAIMGTDWGTLRMYREAAQQAADAAAQAGASFLPTDSNLAERTAIRYAVANLENCPALAGGNICPGSRRGDRLQQPSVKAIVSQDRRSITVRVARQVPMFVLPFMGESSMFTAGVQCYRTATINPAGQARSASGEGPENSTMYSTSRQAIAESPETVVSFHKEHSQTPDLGVLVQ